MTVEMVPRDQLQACAAANRHLRDLLARVEGERDAYAEALHEIAEHSRASGVSALITLAALAPFRKDGQ